MKIILTKDVPKHGKKDDIIEVKDGFGMNYLIKNNLGIVASESNIKKLNTEKRLKETENEKQREKALEIKEILSKSKLVFKVKTGKEDKVFGSVSPKQIEEALKEKNIDIDKKKISINNSLSSLGTHLVKVELHKDVTGEIKVELIKESR